MNNYQSKQSTPDANGISWFHRIQMPDGTYTNGCVHHGPDGGDWPTTRFAMPEDLTGKSVIDIGAWDGFFSFLAEKRGSEDVLATDTTINEGGNWGATAGFEYARKKLNSKVLYGIFNIEKPYPCGTFDLVLFYGVLYHLKSPLVAMENLAKLTEVGGKCLIETAISQTNDRPVLEYRPGFDNDPTNYFYPNHLWVELASKQVGFKSCKLHFDMGSRATYVLEK